MIEVFNRIRQQIPQGQYCYEILRIENTDIYAPPKIHICNCPFYTSQQINGERVATCLLMGESELPDVAAGLLWDKVKICEINYV